MSTALLFVTAFISRLSSTDLGDSLQQQRPIDPEVKPEVVRKNDPIQFRPYILKTIREPLSDIDVFLTVRQFDSNTIIGTVNWTLDSGFSPPKEYKITVEAASEDEHCTKHFAPIQGTRDETTTMYEIPHVPYAVEWRILQFHCTYRVMLKPLPCSGNCETVIIFTIEDCSKHLCSCDACSGNVCQCSSPVLPDPVHLSAEMDAESRWNRSVTLFWSYPEDALGTGTFDVLVYRKASELDGPTSVNDTVFVHYDGRVTYYNYTFLVSENGTYCVEVIASDGMNCSKTSKLKFSTHRPFSGDALQDSESASALVLAIVSASAFTAFLLIGGCLRWRNRIHRGRGILLHSLSRPRVPYESSVSSKSSGLTHTTYLSTEREDVNVLYVEQEIQEAREKGIVDFFEISYGRLTIGEEIGKGAFGRVCIAVAEAIASTPGRITVAVKYLRENASEQEKEDFLDEIAMMKKAGRHPNVVAMIGCCTLQQPYCMVMEYVDGGDLLNYLRRLRAQYESLTGRMIGLEAGGATDDGSRPSTWNDASSSSRNRSTEKLIRDYSSYEGPAESRDLPPDVVEEDPSASSMTTDDGSLPVSGEATKDASSIAGVAIDPLELQGFALQIASGMNHLASRGIVHRDLAARNVLISESRHLKVADFGLSRSGVYVTQRGGRVPLRWLSIEAIRDHVYSTPSDVWAFGVLLWEICTLGGFPYSSISDKDLYKHLLHHRRLERPEHCSPELYCVMQRCWEADPKRRPDFGELFEILERLGRRCHTYVNFDRDHAELPPAERYDTDSANVESWSLVE